MNTSTMVVVGVIVIALIGGALFYMRDTDGSPLNATSTPTGSTNTGQTGTPGTPTAVTSSSASPAETTVVVSGTVNPNGAFTNYWYEFGTTASLGKKTSNQSVGSGMVAIAAPAYITGLAKDTTYFFRLVAENAFGTVSGNQHSFKTATGASAPVGGIPSVKTLAANRITRVGATINGEVTPNQAATQHWFEYGTTPDLGNTSAFVSAGSGTGKATAAIALADLAPGTTYYFRLNAQNQFGTVNGTILNFKTEGPASSTREPAVVTKDATGIGRTTAVLRGTVTPNGVATSYWFEYSTDSLLGSVLLRTTDKKSAGSSANPATVDVLADLTGLTANTTYYFRAVAENAEGLVRGERETFKTN